MSTSINRWALEKRVQSVLYFGSQLISKESLAEFLSSQAGQSIAVKSEIHRQRLAAFTAEQKNSGMEFTMSL